MDAAVEDDYHATGNCALEFTAADSARRAAKHAEPGVKMVELSNGYRVFTQTVGGECRCQNLDPARWAGLHPRVH